MASGEIPGGTSQSISGQILRGFQKGIHRLISEQIL